MMWVMMIVMVMVVMNVIMMQSVRSTIRCKLLVKNKNLKSNLLTFNLQKDYLGLKLHLKTKIDSNFLVIAICLS